MASDGSKKLINSIDTCIDECLAGIAAANPHLVLHSEQRALFDGVPNDNRLVAIVSGAGGGHEPFSVGYVGQGMLTAAVSGSVFASPPSSHILHAIRQVSWVSPGGVYVVIPNYTGDVLNFGLAVQLAIAEGIKVVSIVAGEDIALESHGIHSRAGRRGMCGILILYKIIGSIARSGASLEAISQVGTTVSANIASVSLGLKPCTLPGASSPLFQVPSDEMELGIGVHGEAGVQRMKLKSAKDAVTAIWSLIVNHFQLKPGSEVVILVNNLGGLSQLEQWIIVAELERQIKEQGIILQRIYAAPFFTSLDMAGVLVTCLRLPANHKTDWLAALDDDCSAPAWLTCKDRHRPREEISNFVAPVEASDDFCVLRGPQVPPSAVDVITKCLVGATTAVTKFEEKLNILDSGCGDGDCGTTLRRLADGIQRKMAEGALNLALPATLASQLANVAASTMGGTSGAIYSLFLTYASVAIEKEVDFSLPTTWAEVWKCAISGVQKHSSARVGDRTMFDALEPACEALDLSLSKGMNAQGALTAALAAAVEGCARTKGMRAMAGRASYVDMTQLKDVDAGAFAVTVWLQGILTAFSS